MSISLKKLFVKYWYLFLLLFFAFFVVIFEISLIDLWEGIRSLQAWQLGILLGVFFLISSMNVFLRKYLLSSLGCSTGFRNLLAIHFSSMAAHYSTPAKLGFPVSVFLLKRLEDVPYAVGTTVFLIELFMSTALCGVIGLIGTFFYFMEKNFFIPVLLVMAAGALSFSVVLFLKRSPDSYLGGLMNKMTNSIHALDVKRLVIYSFSLFFVQICSAMNLFLLCIFFSSKITYTQAFVTGSSAFFAGSISMVPMGLGVREASVIFYLGRFGVDGASALSIVTIQRLISTGLSLLIGSCVGGFLARREMARLP